MKAQLVGMLIQKVEEQKTQDGVPQFLADGTTPVMSRKATFIDFEDEKSTEAIRINFPPELSVELDKLKRQTCIVSATVHKYAKFTYYKMIAVKAA